MAGKRYLEEFKLAVVSRITEGQYVASDVAMRPDITVDCLYAWVTKYEPDATTSQTCRESLVHPTA